MLCVECPFCYLNKDKMGHLLDYPFFLCYIFKFYSILRTLWLISELNVSHWAFGTCAD